MLRKLWLSVVAATIGAALLVGASFAASSPTQEGSGEAKRGGTLRVNVSNTDFAFVDPALAYDTLSWGLLYTTNLTLLNYPDRPAPEGSRLVPDAAVAFPRVSRDGRTYTFTVRKGLRFSDGSAVTARNFAHAIHRAAHPTQASPAIAFLHDVVGADELNEGKASRVTGVSANGHDADDHARAAEPDVPRADRDAVLRRGEDEHGARPARRECVSLGRSLPDREP